MALTRFALFALLLVGCGGARLGSGKFTWKKVETQHFALYTSHSSSWAEMTGRSFERWLNAYLQLGWDGAYDFGRRINVVVPSNLGEASEHAGHTLLGYFAANVLFEPWIVIPAEHPFEEDAPDGSTLRHELTHMIAYQAVAIQPKWYAEGIATYYETAAFDDEGRFGIGAPNTDCIATLLQYGDYVRPRYSPIPVTRLFAWEGGEADQHRLYCMAWLLTHYLLSEHAEAFASYQRSLARTGGHDEAWALAFPDLGPGVLDAELERYFHANSFARVRMRVAALDGEIPRVTTLTQAEQLDLKGTLWLTRCANCKTNEEARARASASFNAALRLDPMSLHASVFQSHTDPTDPRRRSRAKQLVDQHPTDPLAWIELGLASFEAQHPDDLAKSGGNTPGQALKELAPGSPYTWMIVANEHLLAGRRSPAVVAVSRGLRASPGDTALLWNAARLLRRAQACRELKEVQGYLEPRVSERTRDDFARLTRDVQLCEDAAAAR